MLEKRDLILAFALHVLIVISLIVLQGWQAERKPIPERLIQVNMVSLQTLQAMQKQPSAKKIEKPKVKPKPKPKSKPIIKKSEVKKKPKPKKPRPKPKPKAVVPALKPKLNPKKVVEEPDFDPFSPLESDAQPEQHTPAKPRQSSQEVLQGLLQGQLSEQELNRYIVGMQKAVEQQWKVPMEMIDRVKPALVSLTLSTTGDVVQIKILQSSGSPILDESLRKAIYAAAPFELPTKQFELFKHNTIRFYPIE